MDGFPEELYQVVYDAPGSPELAHETMELVSADVKIDNTWGIDHGTWSVLLKMFPEADIPVYQLSINHMASAQEHYKIGQELSCLREKGVLILGSGNVVHNLSTVNPEIQGGYPWADTFDKFIEDCIVNRRYSSVIDYESAGESSKQAFYTTEHFYPLLYVLGASNRDDRLMIFNDSRTFGALSMTSYLFE